MDASSSVVRGLDDLDATIMANLDRIPAQLRVVVAPSGDDLMAAAFVSLYRQLPLAVGHRGEARGAGQRLQTHVERAKGVPTQRGLVMLSSIDDEAVLAHARRLEIDSGDPRPPLLGAVFVSDALADEVDIVLQRTTMPTVMAWQLPHRAELERAGVALEGVLAPLTRRPWSRSIRGLEPVLRPSCRIGSIVSTRPSAHRSEVAAWLDRHGIAYEDLTMRPARTFVMGGAAAFAAFKSEHYRRRGASIHIEPDVVSARRLVTATGARAVAWRQQRTVLPRLPDAAESDV